MHGEKLMKDIKHLNLDSSPQWSISDTGFLGYEVVKGNTRKAMNASEFYYNSQNVKQWMKFTVKFKRNYDKK